MASTLKINTLTGVTTAGSIAVTGEGNSTTTNLQQGLCKAWVNYTGISTTAERDSFNVSSLNDITTGQTTVNINNNMANANYSGYYYTNASTGTAYTDFVNQHAGGFGSFETGLFKHNAFNASADVDSFQNLSGIFGDLA
tara:strand:- start:29 stop:448 length:420 start_codon:yes stop_codon:yes gene_type:complete